MASDYFSPPSDRVWARIKNKALRLYPMPFPVTISRSMQPPEWAESTYLAGIYVDHEELRVKSVEIWIDARHSRAALFDSLVHELAHALCLADDPEHGLALLHDNRFWLKYGEVWRAWMISKYGPGGDQ